MYKRFLTTVSVFALISAMAVSISGCAATEWIKPSLDSSDTSSEVSSTTTTGRAVNTTKTATYIDDGDDEEIETYTKMQTVTGGELENDYSDPGYDKDILATMTEATTTLYTLPAGVTMKTEKTTTTKKTTKSDGKTTTTTKKTTTAFKADSLYGLESDMKLKSSVSYKVVSDTTYLNLRYGPSKKYDVQLRIPNGESVTGTGITTDSDGNKWVYTSYNGTSGWVMEKLLKEK